MRVFLVLCVMMFVGFSAGADEGRTKRILIVGDSWAMSITEENRDGFPAADVFDDVLQANGLGGFETQGAVTAWGGRKASDWAKPEHVAEIVGELERYPTIDVVHLILGGNDFLTAVQREGFGAKSAEERGLVWAKVGRDLETVVDACLGVRADIRVLIAGYDYLDYAEAEQVWDMDFLGASVATLNGWMVELGEVKRGIAGTRARCEYLGNWGVLQYWFGTPAKGVSLPGGDITKPMPGGVSADGIHPNAAAHGQMLQGAVDRFYGAWLRSE